MGFISIVNNCLKGLIYLVYLMIYNKINKINEYVDFLKVPNIYNIVYTIISILIAKFIFTLLVYPPLLMYTYKLVVKKIYLF